MLSKVEILKKINQAENKVIEFKESLTGLKSDDIVAFANSKVGGILFIGVKDDTKPDGTQTGTIIGCKINDSTRLTILDKAQSCRPAVNININIHEIDSKKIYAIEIPSGEYKPYCTDGGTYRIRDDGRKRSLYPNELLGLFMESERDKFVISFKDATKTIEDEMKLTKEIFISETNNMIKTLETFEDNLVSTLNGIENSAENAESSSGNLENSISDIEDTVDDIWTILSLSLHLLPSISSQNINKNSAGQELIVAQITENFLKKYIGNEDKLTDKLIKNHIYFLRILFPNFSGKKIVELWNNTKNSMVDLTLK